MQSILLNYLDEFGSPLDCSLFINGVLNNVGNTSSISSTGIKTFKIVPDDTSYLYKEFTIDLFNASQLLTWDIVFTTALTQEINPRIIWAKDTCTKKTSISLNKSYPSLGEVRWYIGGVQVATGIDILIDTQTVTQLKVVYSVDTNEYEEYFTFNQSSGVTNVSLLMNCGNKEKQTDFINNTSLNCETCIEDFNCSCKQQNDCECIKIGQEVTFSYLLDFNNSCGGEARVQIKLRVDGELLDVFDYYDGDTLDPVTLSFTEPGEHIIQVQAINCCGVCSFEKAITVGGYITVTNESCDVYSVKAYYNYTGVTSASVQLFNLEAVQVASYTQTPYNFDNFTFKAPAKDAVYIASFNLLSETGAVLYTYKFLVINLCRIKACNDDIINKLACTNCNNCKSSAEQAQLDANICKFNTFYTMLLSLIDRQNNFSSKRFNLDTALLSQLDSSFITMETIIKELNKICSNCGYGTV